MSRYESQDRSPTLSEKDKGRLRAFQHLLRQVRTYERTIYSGKILHWGYQNQDGRIAETHLILNKDMMRRLRKMAIGMYVSDLSQDPHVKEIADSIVAMELEGKDTNKS